MILKKMIISIQVKFKIVKFLFLILDNLQSDIFIKHFMIYIISRGLKKFPKSLKLKFQITHFLIEEMYVVCLPYEYIVEMENNHDLNVVNHLNIMKLR